MKQSILLILLSLVCLIIVNGCATTDTGEIQAQYLEDKIRENPHVIELYMYLIDYSWNEKADLRKALRIANECMRNNANNPKAHILAAQTLFNTGYVNAGENFLHRRLSEQNNYDALLLLSEKLCEQNNLDDARKLLIEYSLEDIQNPNLIELSETDRKYRELIQLELAKLDFVEKKYNSSIIVLSKLVNEALNPAVRNSAGILLMRIFTQNKDFEKIEDLTNQLLEQSAITGEFIELMTYAYIHNKQHNKLANKLVKIYKKTQDIGLKQTIMFQLVLNEVLRDKISDALQYVKLGLELKPVYSPFLIFDYYLNLYNSEKKDSDEVEAKREALLSYDLQYFEAPEKFETFKEILSANLLRYLGFYEPAEETYNKILESEKDSTWAMLAQAELSLDQKKYNDAIYWYYKTISSGMRNSDIYCQIADCLIKSGEYEKAYSTFDYAQGLFPENIRIMKGIEIARVKKDDYKLQNEYPYIFSTE